eukprot:6978408-Lingulodinium_polyedra.AAC.1
MARPYRATAGQGGTSVDLWSTPCCPRSRCAPALRPLSSLGAAAIAPRAPPRGCCPCPSGTVPASIATSSSSSPGPRAPAGGGGTRRGSGTTGPGS